MAKKEQVPKNYFSFHLMVLRLLGINIFEIQNPFLRILYNTYAYIFIIISFLSYTLFELWALYENRNDLYTSTFIMCYWITHFMGCLKGGIFLLNSKNIKKYLTSFEEGVFIPNIKRGGEKEVEIIKNAIKVANAQANIFYIMAAVVIANRTIYSILDQGTIESTYDPVTNTTSTIVVKTLPWYSWFWFDTRPTPNYQIAFFYQVWCISIFGVEIGILDALVAGMLVHLNSQFSILKNAVETIIERAVRMQITDTETTSNQHKIINNYISSLPNNNPKLTARSWETVPRMDPSTAKYLNSCMADCLEHHNKIIDLSNNIEEQFNVMILIQFLGSTLLFCFQLFQLSFVSFPSFKFISMSVYLILMLFQLTIYCYNGNEISIQSEEISAAAYSTDWFGAEDSLKKSLILMMVRAQRPIRMSAGKFAFLSLATLMNIIRGSVSYYMVLHRMNG